MLCKLIGWVSMGNRVALFVSVLFAGVALTMTSLSAAPAADECLAKPKGVAPEGKHWYYRTNRTIQRKCWYLGDDGETVVTPTPRKQSASTTPAEPAREATKPTSTDARAELV